MMVKHWNGRKILLAPGGIDAIEYEKEERSTIAKKLTQAHRRMKMIEASKHPMRTVLTEKPGLDPSNIVKTLNLLNLSPKIQKMIVEGNLPSVTTLKRLYGEVPLERERHKQGNHDEKLAPANLFSLKIHGCLSRGNRKISLLITNAVD